MATTTATREKSLEAFLAGYALFEELLDELHDLHLNHYDTDPDNVNWADVTQMTRRVDLLLELLGKKG
jgi:hypothetical protein